MKTYIKFVSIIVVIVGTLAWLAAGGIRDTKTYYKTVEEVRQMGGAITDQRLRVGGNVEAGSIVRTGGQVAFTLDQNNHKLKVLYIGTEPLPDTFRDEAEALADGRLGEDGVFRATKIQAKCASKYEAAPGSQKPITTARTER